MEAVMKKLISSLLTLLFVGTTSLTMAQNAPAPAPAPVVHPRIHEVHARIKEQRERIAAGLKSGAMTKEQAQAAHAQLKSIRTQMEADFQTNGKRELTEAQKAQLNGMLDQSSKLIFDDKHSSPAPAPAQ
jgi:multidrug resistance efflux pump